MPKQDNPSLGLYLGEIKHKLLRPWEERALGEIVQRSHETIVWHLCQIPFIIRRMRARYNNELYTQKGKGKSKVVKWLDPTIMGYADLKPGAQNQHAKQDLEAFLECRAEYEQLKTTEPDESILSEHQRHCLRLGKRLRLRRNALQGWVHDLQQLNELDEAVLEKEAGCSVGTFHRHFKSIMNAYRNYADACEALVFYNRRLVVRIAKQRNFGRDLLEVISDGNVGLYDATHKFEWRRGKFSIHAANWIKHRIDKGAGEGPSIPLPQHIRKDLLEITKTSRRLEQRLERRPLAEEVAEAINKEAAEASSGSTKPKTISVRHVQDILEASRLIAFSLDDRIEDDDNSDSFGELIIDPTAECPQVNALRVLRAEKVNQILLQNLTVQERQIISLQFWEGLDVKAVAKKLGLPHKKVRQLEALAIRKLSQPSVKRQLEAYRVLGDK
jgi:RNA polymerase sigma factor (sigma-70 family)